MPEPLFTVDDTFTIRGRGIVLLGITADQYNTSIRMGDAVSIQRPDGTIVPAKVSGLEAPHTVKWMGPPPPLPRFGVLVDIEVVPVGSIVYKRVAQ